MDTIDKVMFAIGLVTIVAVLVGMIIGNELGDDDPDCLELVMDCFDDQANNHGTACVDSNKKAAALGCALYSTAFNSYVNNIKHLIEQVMKERNKHNDTGEE